MTPKVIHYVWVGGAPKPPIVVHCIESWRRFCPGWEIREWGDESLDGVGNRYLREAVEHRKWTFAADYLRLKILNDCGGFYLDSDLELLKPIDGFCAFDFVRAISASSAVVTDSFHGLQFATLFRRPFVALGELSNPRSNASRLVDFGARYGLSGGVHDIEQFRSGASCPFASFASFNASALDGDRDRSMKALVGLLP